MGQGQEVKTKDDAQVEIQEGGKIFFFYRSRVNKEEARSPDDVQRLYIVLRPESGERPVEEKRTPIQEKKKGSGGSGKSEGGGHGRQEVNIEKQPSLRFIVKGRKSLPDPGKKGRPYRGFVEMVTTNIDDVKTALQRARALGEGVYRILRHEGGKKHHTHVIYKLEFPLENESNEPQESLNIKHEGSFHIQIKNPNPHASSSTSSRSRGLRNKRTANFPAHLQDLFGKLRHHPVDPPDFLNYKGCEFLLISASDVEEELGLDLQTEGEANEFCSDLIKTFGETASTKPLLKALGCEKKGQG
ncbi:unnamed protein product [Malus baccata var. baccata]